MTKRIKRIIASLLATTALISGSVFCASAESLYDRKAKENYDFLNEILDLYVQTSLYKTDKDELIEKMLYNFIAQNPGLLPALANSALMANDPYSSYHIASSGFMSSTNTSYGFVVADSSSFDDDDPRKAVEGVYVTEVLKGSNSEFAGLMAGDRLISLDGINVEGLTNVGVRYLLQCFPVVAKDPESSKVYKEFFGSTEEPDPAKLEEYTKLERDPAKEVEFVVERTLHDGSISLVTLNISKGLTTNKDIYLYIDKELAIATIEIVAFDTANVVEEFKAAFDEAKNAGCKKLIIDMRDNPGGYFEAAQKLGSLFTKGVKPMFYIRNRDTEEPIAYISENNYVGDAFEEYAVLINENTASAAELFAYILRNETGATIIGKTSFGKALGQTAYNVANGDMFTITTFEILTADKQSYNGIGIIPDVDVPLVPQKYEFPTGLSHFNHENYVTIAEGVTNDATLALEQRFGILGLLRESAIDGLCDKSTLGAIIAYKYAGMGVKFPNSEITPEMVSDITTTINSYKNRIVFADAQTDVAKLYLQNHSRGKRLAKESVTALEKYEKALKEKEEQNRIEYEKMMEEERKANMEAEEDISTED